MNKGVLFLMVLLVPGLAPCNPAPARPGDDEAVSIDADRLSFERQRNVVNAEGNVTIRRGQDVLRADHAVLHTTNRQAHASGNVVFSSDNFEWRGEKLSYNFVSGRWASSEFSAYVQPFHVAADGALNLPDDQIQLQDGFVTTCELPGLRAHYRINASRVLVRPDDRLLVHHARLYLGRLPVFYTPIWRASLDPDFGFHFEPGYRGRMGAYLLSSYRYRINPGWRGQTHVDYRSRRGLALGQDLDWTDAARLHAGRMSGYFINDRDPYLDHDPESVSVDQSRYRLQVTHQWHPTSRDTLRGNLEYVSDETLREDFFERAYRRAVQPDNYITYVHRWDDMALTVLGRARLNDFYEHIDRLPEVTLDVHRRRLGESPVFYENQNSAVALRQHWPDRQAIDSIAVNRIDSRHGLFWPMRHFGFLNLVPRVGGQATYYSKTFDNLMLEETFVSVNTNQFVSADGVTNVVETMQTETRTRDTRVESGSAVRTLFFLGLESSFQAARIWHTGPRPWGRDLRHVVEPYINYTFVPEPSLTPDRLHPFDDTDRLDRQHVIAFGVRNFLQTKRDQRSHDLLDLNLFSSYRLDSDAGGSQALGPVGLRAEARPTGHWGLDMTAVYDTHESVLNELNGRLYYHYATLWRGDLDYRYRHEQSRLLAGSLTLTPNRDWSFSVYGRYEAEDSRLEEHAWHVQRNLDCMSIRSGFSHLPSYTRADGSERDNEYRVTLEVWLTAFPGMRTGMSSRH